VDSDDDTDTQGVGLASTAGGHRFSSDPLRFTGIDLGDRDGVRPRRNYTHGSEEDDDESDETSDNDSAQGSDDGDDQGQLALREKEDEALQSAMARIRRAQAKGKKDVKLSQDELKALERQRQRMQDDGRKKQKEKRFAVPLSHVEPTSRKRVDAAPGNSPPQPQASDFDEAQQHRGYPPMGYFPPPSSAQRPPRPRSGTVSSRPPSRSAVDREQSSSPFAYTYVQRAEHAAAVRHSSDPATGRPRSRAPSIGGIDTYPPTGTPDGARQSGAFDPFQYMTASNRSSYSGGSPAMRQPAGGSPRMSGPAPRTNPGPSASNPSRRQSKDESSSEEETSSEEEENTRRATPPEDHGARISTSSGGNRERLREPEADERRLSREQSPPQALRRSPTKSGTTSGRKTGGGGTSSGKRRKGK